MLLRRHKRMVNKAVEKTAFNCTENDIFSQFESNEENKYTKTDINRLSTAELKELATKENIPNVESKSGGELKKELINHFNL